MSFTDPIFLPFLALVFFGLWLAPSPVTAATVLLGAGALFYGWWDPRFLALLLFVSVVDFFVARRIGAERDPARRRAWLAVSIVSNLGLLFTFKYAGFFVDNWNALGLPRLPAPELTLPIGISFFTFEALSYSFDCYRGTIVPTRRLGHFLLFLSFFPHLVAGPIVRARDFLPQLEGDFRLRADASGVFHVVLGFAKKCLLADLLGSVLVDRIFANPGAASPWELLFAVYGYTFQIFLDFSAYSDIAIGIAKCLGFELGKNFDAPYLSRSFGEFWRRWHISLSSWFRDYVYLPLGGNRVSSVRWGFNIGVTFLLSGLWHGADWKFIVWGGLHGAAVAGERWIPWPVGEKGWGGWLRALVVFHFAAFAWIFFRAESLTAARDFLRAFQTGTGTGGPGAVASAATLVAVAALLHVTVEPRRYALAEAFCRLPAPAQAAGAMLTAIAVYEVALWNLGRQAFIYFQF